MDEIVNFIKQLALMVLCY